MLGAHFMFVLGRPMDARIASRPGIEGCAPMPCAASAPAALANRTASSSGIPLALATANASAKASPRTHSIYGDDRRRSDIEDSTRGDDERGIATAGDDHLAATGGGARTLRLGVDLGGRHGNERDRLLRIEDAPARRRNAMPLHAGRELREPALPGAQRTAAGSALTCVPTPAGFGLRSM